MPVDIDGSRTIHLVEKSKAKGKSSSSTPKSGEKQEAEGDKDTPSFEDFGGDRHVGDRP
jgi:hypothetical protein